MPRDFINLTDPFTPTQEELQLFHDAFPDENWLDWAPGKPIPGGLDEHGAQVLLAVLTWPQLPSTAITQGSFEHLNELEREWVRASTRCRRTRTKIKRTSDPATLSQLQAKLADLEAAYAEVSTRYKEWRRQQRLRHKYYATGAPPPTAHDTDDLSVYDRDLIFQSFSDLPDSDADLD